MLRISEDAGLAGRADQVGIRRGVRRGPPRRREVARQGADLLVPRRLRPVGSRRTSVPNLWNIYNARIDKGETIRVFPLSNWTELDVWQYIHLENIPIVPLYFAKERPMVVRGESLLPIEHDPPLLLGEKPQMVMSRMRSLGCTPCTGAIRSSADTLPKIIEELFLMRRSERENRIIDHDQEGSMEIKKREGYF